jgi:ABC-type antimicrobial peptide transport system permease subunit
LAPTRFTSERYGWSVVARRTKEIGVRKALGVRPLDVIREVLQPALVLTLTGIAIGVGLTLAAGQIFARSTYAIGPSDPATLVVTALGFTLVAMGASWWPARRAMKIDPVRSLKME